MALSEIWLASNQPDKLEVYVSTGQSLRPVRCGTLARMPNGAALFTYHRSYLDWKHAFPLVPNLALGPQMNLPPGDQKIFSVFSDSGPDRWGRRVIDKV